jgi:hypothetical protein
LGRIFELKGGIMKKIVRSFAVLLPPLVVAFIITGGRAIKISGPETTDVPQTEPPETTDQDQIVDMAEAS